MSFLARQSVASGSIYDTTATVELGAIVEGNLLIATAAERSGATAITLSGTGWTPFVTHAQSPADGTYRKTLYMWYKMAAASEPTSITVTFDSLGAVYFSVIEYATVADAAGPMQLVEAVSAGYDTVIGSYYPGALAPFTAERCLLVGSVMSKTGADTELPYSVWASENLLSDVTYNGGVTSVDGAVGSLDMYDVSPFVELTSTAQNSGAVNADRGGIVALAAFVPVTAPPPTETSLLTESGLILLTESGQPILI